MLDYSVKWKEPGEVVTVTWFIFTESVLFKRWEGQIPKF